MDKWRRYVCLAVNNCNRTYPLRRIDASSLFYPTNEVKNTAMPPDESQLPRPCISFSPSPTYFPNPSGGLTFFGFFGLGKKKTVLAAVDYHGVSLTYDVDDCIIKNMATPHVDKRCEPVSVALNDALYVLDRRLIPGRQSCFEVLTFGPPKELPKETLLFISNWQWHILQPPPFMFEPSYKTTSIDAYTVVGGSNILISTRDHGTYSFDTVSSTWSKAGDWELPFQGRAEFIPEHGMWIGFSAQENQLCYLSDLRTSMKHQPALDMVWDDPTLKIVYDDPIPKRYARIIKSQLVHLGSGKFCAARWFERVEDELTEFGNIPQVEKFSVLTGLVLKASEFGRGIEMIPHKSLLYRFEGISNFWLF